MLNKKSVHLLTFLLIFISCNEEKHIPMYFRSLQPKNGKIVQKNLKEHFLKSIPKSIYIGTKDIELNRTHLFRDSTNKEIIDKYFDKHLGLISNDDSELLKFFLPIIMTDNFGVEAKIKEQYVILNIHFGEGQTIAGKIELETLFPDSFFTTKGIPLSKENIICFNKKINNEYYHLSEVWEFDRSNKEINIYKEPFIAQIVSKKPDSTNAEMINIEGKNGTYSNIPPLKNFSKYLEHHSKAFNLEIIDYNDSLKTYSANPNYTALKNSLRKEDVSSNVKTLYLDKIFENISFLEKSDSLKYKALDEFYENLLNTFMSSDSIFQ